MRNATLLALAGMCLAALPAAAQEVQLVQPYDGTVLDISATGTTTRTPDVAVIQAGVVTQAAGAADAMQQNSTRMASLLAALRKAGVAERDIQTTDVSLNPQYRYAENQPPVITGYQAANTVSVRFRDVAKSGPILDTLVRQGANNISGPALRVDKPEAALDEARVQAVATARARADLYAKAAGLRVERILSISESGTTTMPPVPVFATRARVQSADTEVAAGERDLSVNLTVRFLLK